MFGLVREVGAWNSGHFALRSLQTVVNSDSCSILGFIYRAGLCPPIWKTLPLSTLYIAEVVYKYRVFPLGHTNQLAV